MNFLEKLDFLINEKKMNKHQLSQATGIPYTTIDSFYKKGYDNIKLSTLLKLADYFNCSLDYLVDDDTKEYNKLELSKSKNTKILIQLHEAVKELSEDEQRYLLDTIQLLKRHFGKKQ